MTDPQTDRLALHVQTLAATFTYPTTPDVAARVAARVAAGLRAPQPARQSDPVRQRWAVAVLVAMLVICFSALAVPQVRATLADVLQIGAVRIFVVSPTPTLTATSLPLGTPSPILVPTSTLLPSLLDLIGKTTLADARANFGYAIPLPTYPANLGQPDYVFMQDFGGPVVFLVWVDPSQPTQVRLALHLISPGSYAVDKVAPTVVQTTTVNGQSAVWAEGPYMLFTTGGGINVRRLIEGHVLIWKDPSGVTYRLETDQSLDEAIKIAGSLK